MKFPYKWEILAIGADPEVFFVDKDDKPVSVEGKLGGTKENPRPMTGLPAGFAIQEDNVAAEYNIPASSTSKGFSTNILRGLKYVDKQAKKQGYKVVCESAMNFTLDQLATPHAQNLGCEPDFNAWTKALNKSPIPPATLRTAAGHVHISWGGPTGDSAMLFGRALDVYLGIPSLLVTNPNDRRKLYGRAGAIRLKNYGVEYRVLDNFWLNNEKQCNHIFDMCHTVANKLNRGQSFMEDELEFCGAEIQQVINTHDRDGAIHFMKQFNVPAFPLD